MGWSGGSSLMKVIISQISKYVPSASLRVRIYQPIVDAFQAQDWDTQAECLGEDVAFDEVIRESHPELLDDADEDDYDDVEEVLDDLDDEDDEEDLDDIDDDDDDDEDEDDDEEEEGGACPPALLTT